LIAQVGSDSDHEYQLCAGVFVQRPGLTVLEKHVLQRVEAQDALTEHRAGQTGILLDRGHNGRRVQNALQRCRVERPSVDMRIDMVVLGGTE